MIEVFDMDNGTMFLMVLSLQMDFEPAIVTYTNLDSVVCTAEHAFPCDLACLAPN